MFGTILSLAGTAASGIFSAIGNAQYKKQLAKDKEANDAYYTKELMQDPTKRSDNAYLLRQLENQLQRANDTFKAKNKMMGGTNESVLANQQYNADAYADAVGQMQSLSSQRRDTILAQKQASDEKSQELERARQQGLMQNWANLADNAAKLGASAANGLGAKNSLSGDNQATAQAGSASVANPLENNFDLSESENIAAGRELKYGPDGKISYTPKLNN